MSLARLIAAAALLAASAAAQERMDFALENGVPVTVVHAPGAPTQTSFTFLDLGLARDEAGRAQFSHLVEHMLIRSTDPGSLVVGGLRINGETTAGALRLETMAPAEQWREALERHGKWLAARAFDAETLAREKAAIAREEEATVRNNAMHKWAQAAWSQVCRHGRGHAAVHGDVEKATVEDVTDYVHRRVGLPLRVVTIGPVAPDAIREAAAEVFAELRPAAPDRTRLEPPAPGDRNATWDLGRRVYVEFYPLPRDGRADRALGQVLAQLLQLALARDAELARTGARVLASADVDTPEGRWLFLSASLPDGTPHTAVRQRLRAVAAAFPADPTLRVVRPTLAPKLPAYEAPGTAWAAQRLMQHLLQLTYAELSVGATPPDFTNAYAGLSEETMRVFAARVLHPDRRGSLYLQPK